MSDLQATNALGGDLVRRMAHQLLGVLLLDDPFVRLGIEAQPDLLTDIVAPPPIGFAIQRDLPDLGDKAGPSPLRHIDPHPLDLPERRLLLRRVRAQIMPEGRVDLDAALALLGRIALPLYLLHPGELLLPSREVGTLARLAPRLDQAVTPLDESILLGTMDRVEDRLNAQSDPPQSQGRGKVRPRAPGRCIVHPNASGQSPPLKQTPQRLLHRRGRHLRPVVEGGTARAPAASRRLRR